MILKDISSVCAGNGWYKRDRVRVGLIEDDVRERLEIVSLWSEDSLSGVQRAGDNEEMVDESSAYILSYLLASLCLRC